MTCVTASLYFASSTTPPKADNDDPLAEISRDHQRQRELCNLLEHLADELPGRCTSELARAASISLRSGLASHMQLEEQTLFPLLRQRCADDEAVEQILQQLQHEHEIDESFAEELADELDWLAANGHARNSEMLGYMLRGFFVSQRRHIDWEETTVMPLARNVLTADDLGLLRRALDDQRSGDHTTKGLAGTPLPDTAEEPRVKTCTGDCANCKPAPRERAQRHGR